MSRPGPGNHIQYQAYLSICVGLFFQLQCIPCILEGVIHWMVLAKRKTGQQYSGELKKWMLQSE